MDSCICLHEIICSPPPLTHSPPFTHPLTYRREQLKEQLRVEFAEKAGEIQEYIRAKGEQVANLAGKLDEQVDTMSRLQAEFAASTSLKEIAPISEALEERGVVTNPHTTENFFTLTAQWEALGKVYASSSAALQEQVLAEKGRQISFDQKPRQNSNRETSPTCFDTKYSNLRYQLNVHRRSKKKKHFYFQVPSKWLRYQLNVHRRSKKKKTLLLSGPEQMAEIIEVFEFFDSNGSGSLSVSEFWSCCTGIGVVLSEDEVNTTFNELDASGDKMISLDEFSVWMADRLTQPSHTEADVTDSFDVLNEWPVAYPPPKEKKTTVGENRIEQCFFNEEARAYVLETLRTDPKYAAPRAPPVFENAQERGAEEEAERPAADQGPEYLITPFVTNLFSR